MPRALCCQFCRAELEPAQEFAFHVESQTVGDPTMLAAIRRLPHANGRPLRVCRSCEARVARAAARRRPGGAPALLTAVAAVGVWAITAKLSQWLTDGV